VSRGEGQGCDAILWNFAASNVRLPLLRDNRYSERNSVSQLEQPVIGFEQKKENPPRPEVMQFY